ncbi:MAG: hypothetical protein RLZZ15_3777 [Verrucomicrobiota bacterium]|jgi:hypothetical protein
MSHAGANAEILRRRRAVRGWLGLFIAGLVVSGLTAFPLLHELRLLCAWFGLPPSASPADATGLAHWLLLVRDGLADTYARYPFIGYGTDWLAFGHLVIALFFVAPWREPGRHLENLRVGMLACALVIPLALICGAVRGIPFYWRLIDCSFGIIGVGPLWLALRHGRALAGTRGDSSPR